jgi:subtilase family serine protease
VTQHYQAAGLTVTRSGTTQLHVTGSAAAIERAFGVQLHSFVEASSTPTGSAHRYRAALGPVHIPPSIAAHVQGVWGLDTRAHARPAARQAKIFPKGFGNVPDTPDPPGFWTVVDVAKYYDVEPLYQRGLDGTGRTIGIVTLASFTQSDAYAYWAALGLNVAQDRIRKYGWITDRVRRAISRSRTKQHLTSSSPAAWHQRRRSGFTMRRILTRALWMPAQEPLMTTWRIRSQPAG